MSYKERKGKIKDSTPNIEWHGHHDGKYYNRSRRKHFCNNCKKWKPVQEMCYVIKDVWTCNICALAIQKEKKRIAVAKDHD